MEIRNLQTFLQVAAMQNFTRAAEQLGYTQPNVSFQIRQLEEELGVVLFDRIGHSAMLTQYGHNLIPYAKQIVSDVMAIENMIKTGSDLDGIIRIGFCESLFEQVFETAFSSFHEKYPKIRLDVTVDGTVELLELLKNNKIDAALIIDNPLPAKDWNIWFQRKEAIDIVCSPNHPLAGKKDVSMMELASCEFVSMEEDAPYVLDFNRIVSENGLFIDAALRLQKPSTAINILKAGTYVSLLPRYSVQSALDAGEISTVNVDGISLFQHVQFALHKNKVIIPQIEAFLTECAAISGC